MNKYISLLFAALFFIAIVVTLAAVLWFSNAPSDTKSSLTSTAKSTAEISENLHNLYLEKIDSNASNATGYSIICRVNDPNGEPVGNASVVFESLEDRSYMHSAYTDASGGCRILALQEGTYLLTASAPGYSPAKETVSLSRGALREQTRILTLKQPTYALSGKIMTHAGRAIQNATVSCVALSNAQNGLSARDSILEITRSQKDGSFAFERLLPGDYSLSAQCGGYLSDVKKITIFQNQYAIVRLDTAARLNGVVMDEWKRPIANAGVSIQSNGRFGVYTTALQSEANGRFIEYAIPPQSTTITVRAEGYQTAQKSLDIDRSTHDIELILSAASISIRGTVLNARTQSPLSGLALEIMDRRISHPNPVKVQETVSGEGGSFAFSNLLPAQYTIQLAERERTRFPHQSIDLPQSFEDVDNAIFEIQEFASVSGRVLDESGNPIAGAEVEMLLPDAPRAAVRTDERGAYTFPFLSTQRQTTPSGKVSARAMASHINYAPGFSDRFEFANGDRIENLNVVLGKGIAIQGKVTTQQYRPIVGAQVFAQIFEGRGDRRETITDERGNYRIDRIPSAIPPEAFRGTQQIALGARAEGFEYQLRAAPIESAETLTENFILRDAGNLSGTVLLPDGSPAPGAKLTLMGAMTQSAESNDGGRFEFKNVREASTLQIVAQYGPSRYQFPQKRLSDRNIFGNGAYFAYAIPIKPNDLNIIIVLQPENGVVGKVTDGETGEPITQFKATLAYYFPQYDKYLNWSIREGTWSVPSPGCFGFSAPIPGEYLFTVEADGYIPARFELPFRETGLTKILNVELTQSGKGSVLGKIAPYDFHGNIKRLQLIGRGVDWPLHLITDRSAPSSNVASFQADNVPPGRYEVFCVFTYNEVEIRKPLTQFEVNADNAVDLGVLDVSSIHVKPTPWPTLPH